MIPIRTNIPSKRWPFVVVFLIAVNLAIFFYELSLGRGLETFIRGNALIPERFMKALDTCQVELVFLPLFFSLFMHGGWFHLLSNMLYLWIFGANIEDRLGHIRFFLFFLLCGIAASILHISANPSSQIPTIGASGAVAGLLGAYLVFYPTARILTLVPIFFFIRIMELPALLFLGIWFFIQFLSGISSLSISEVSTGGVAWWAHIGGFIAGGAIALLMRLFSRRRR